MTTLNKDALASLEKDLTAQYQQLQQAQLKLDLTRGKPSADQLDLSNGLDGVLQGRYCLEDGTDTRNYGGLEGIPQARQLGADLLGLKFAEVLAGGNSSLTLMYEYLLTAYFYGVRGPDSAWRHIAGGPKFLCPVPGYDRHFTICEDLGIQMIPVPLTAEGPDMDVIESLVKSDPSIKGMWCVPKYSNPTGHVYSSQVVERIAALGKLASPNFRVMWDNAYAVHDLEAEAPVLANVMEFCRKHGTEDHVVQFASTSKITFAGAGIAFVGASEENLKFFKQRLFVFTIGPDKVRQWQHVRFLQNFAGLKAHMQQHAAILKPKFDAVLQALARDCSGFGTWTVPQGGYFVSFDTQPGLAKEVVRLANEAGVKLTPAGATFPYQKDPNDSNIRLAPSFPPVVEVQKAMEVFTVCVRLASVRQQLKA